MIRSYVDVRALAAIATTPVPLIGFQSNQRVKLLELRTPTDVIAVCTINVYVDGILRFQLIPSIFDNVININEDLPVGAEVTLAYVKGDAVAQNLGVTAVFDVI